MALNDISTAALDSFSDETCCDPAVTRLRDRVTVVGDDKLTEMQSVVRVTGARGTFELRHDLDAPIPLNGRMDRLRQKAAALLGADKASRAWGLAQNGSPAEIGAFLRG